MPVVTGLPCHVTSRGSPTFTETNFIFIFAISPSHIPHPVSYRASQSSSFANREKRRGLNAETLRAQRRKQKIEPVCRLPRWGAACCAPTMAGLRLDFFIFVRLVEAWNPQQQLQLFQHR